MSKLLMMAVAFGLVIVSAASIAQDSQKTARCQAGCLRYCANALGTYKTLCQSRCMDSCLKK